MILEAWACLGSVLNIGSVVLITGSTGNLHVIGLCAIHIIAVHFLASSLFFASSEAIHLWLGFNSSIVVTN